MGPLGAVSEYMIQVIKKMQYENLKSWVPKQDVTGITLRSNHRTLGIKANSLNEDSFNEHTQAREHAS